MEQLLRRLQLQRRCSPAGLADAAGADDEACAFEVCPYNAWGDNRTNAAACAVAARQGSSPRALAPAAMSLALVPGQTAQTVTPSGAPATVGGVLQPPPDIKSIIDKTAQFVARNGPEFEQRILCAMLNPQAFPQPQTPVLTLARPRRPPRAALNTQLAVG